ncbi:uncharacterized protein LOC143222775 [Tachypleus tridentatus]|uniref:uncharacterized protein LOC143222775 n=1 Tax=Tachypleus tridentatus TaxID=6853 RepID=UPI003FD2CCA6
MDKKFLLFAFILLSCCLGSRGFHGFGFSSCPFKERLFNILICNDNVNNGTRVARYKCILDKNPTNVRNAKELCQNQTASDLTDLEFLDAICTNATVKEQFNTCVNDELNSSQNYFPFFPLKYFFRRNRCNCGVNLGTFLICLDQNP